MTKEEKLEAFAMLLDGHTLQTVGERFGISKQGVQQMLTVTNIRIDMAAQSCVYPNISRWMAQNGYGYMSIAKMCDISPQTVQRTLSKGSDCKKSFIDKILKVTGMTYEEAEEFIGYNTIRAIPYAGDKAPIVMYKLPREENYQ